MFTKGSQKFKEIIFSFADDDHHFLEIENHRIQIQSIEQIGETHVYQLQDSDSLATHENIAKWRFEKGFSTWLQHGDRPDFVRCSLCCILFKCLNKEDLIKHQVLPRHQDAESQFKKSASLQPVKTKMDMLLEDKDLKPWFTVDSQGQPFCSCCQAYLRGGKKDLMRHAKTEKHLKFLLHPNREYCFRFFYSY